MLLFVVLVCTFLVVFHKFKKPVLLKKPRKYETADHTINEKDITVVICNYARPGNIVEIIKEFYSDKTDKSGRFVAVTVKFKKKLTKPIKLEEIKKNEELSHLSLIKQSRLSVMTIDSKSWKILNKMSKI